MERHQLRFDEETKTIPTLYMEEENEKRQNLENRENLYVYSGKLKKGVIRFFLDEEDEDKEGCYLMEDEKTISSFKVIHPYEVKVGEDSIRYTIDELTRLEYVGDDKDKILMVSLEEEEDVILLRMRVVDYQENYFENESGYLSMIDPDYTRKPHERKENIGFLRNPMEKKPEEKKETSVESGYLETMFFGKR